MYRSLPARTHICIHIQAQQHRLLCPLVFLLAVIVLVSTPSVASFAAPQRQPNPASLTASPTAYPMEQLGAVPGRAGVVAAEPGLALLGGTNRITILNTVDVANPRMVSTLEIPGTIQGAVLRGQYAYITYHGGLKVIDLFDPTTPSIVGSFSTPHWVIGPSLFGSYAIISDEGYDINAPASVLHVLDVSNPSKPTQVATIPDSTSVSQVLVASHPVDRHPYVYVLDSYRKLRIYDLSIPTTPTLVSTTNVPVDYEFVLYEDAASHKLYAYGTDRTQGNSGVQVLDLTNVLHPIPVAFVPLPNPQYRLSIIGNILLTATDQDMHVFDITQPDSLTLVSTMPISVRATPVVIDAQHALIGTTTDIQIMNLANPSIPTVETAIKTLTTSSVLFNEEHMYVSANSEIEVVDIFNPAVPHLAGSVPGDLIAIANQRMVTFGGGQFILNDITGPTPIKLGALTIPFNYKQANDLAIAGPLEASSKYVYLTWNQPDTLPLGYGYANAGFLVIDATDPSALAQVGSLTIREHVAAMGVNYPYIYLTTTDYTTSKLYVVDLSQPRSPIIRGVVAIPSRVLDLAVDATRVYLATEAHGLQIIDATQPTLPRIVGHYTLTGTNTASGVAVDRRLVYLLHSIGPDASTVYVIDASSAATPTILNQLHIGLYASRLRVQNGLIGLPHSYDGISLLRYGSTAGNVVDTMNMPVSGVTINNGSDANTASAIAASGFTGSYIIAGLTTTEAVQGNVITPRLAGYTSWPAQRSIGEAEVGKANFTVLAPPTTIRVTSADRARGGFTDVSGATTSFAVEGGAFAGSATLLVTPTIGHDLAPWAFAGHAFELGLVGSTTSPSFALATLTYRASEVRLVRDKLQLTLRHWDGNTWQDAAASCTPSGVYIRDLVANTLSIPLCQVGRYALFGPTNRVFLPMAMR